MMEWTTATKIIFTLLTFILAFLLLQWGHLWLNRFAEKKKMRPGRTLFAHKCLRIGIALACTLGLAAVWGIQQNDIWTFITGAIAIVAIGFFAVWSILSNIVAGFFIFLSDPFRIDDRIVLVPDEIHGRVTDIKSLFVVLEDDEGNVMHVPNNMFFQKTVKRLKRHESAENS